MHMYSSEIEKFSFAGKTIPKLMSRGDLATIKGALSYKNDIEKA